MKKLVQDKIESVKKKADQGFAERFYDMNFIIEIILLPLLIGWSATTEYFFLSITFGRTFSISATLALTLTAIAILEIGKYTFGKKGVHLYLSGIFAKDSHYLPWAGILLVVNIAFYGGSYYMSVKGSKITADVFSRQKIPVSSVLINTDSINAVYDNKLAEIAPAQKRALTSTWKGKLTQTGARLAKSIQIQKNAIEQQRTAALSVAEGKNKEIKADYENKIASKKTWFQLFAGWGEILQLLLIVLMTLYDLGVEKDEGIARTTTQKKSRVLAKSTPPLSVTIRDKKKKKKRAETETNPETETAPAFETTRRIGFQHRVSVSETSAETEAQIKLLKRKIQSYEWKLRNGKGKPETARKNIANLQAEILRLKDS